MANCPLCNSHDGVVLFTSIAPCESCSVEVHLRTRWSFYVSEQQDFVWIKVDGEWAKRDI